MIQLVVTRFVFGWLCVTIVDEKAVTFETVFATELFSAVWHWALVCVFTFVLVLGVSDPFASFGETNDIPGAAGVVAAKWALESLFVHVLGKV